MPIYEYECAQCGRIIEATQRISDPPLTECPECRGELHKLISLSSFQLKGSGWYATDYSKNKDAQGAPAADAKGGKDGKDGKGGKGGEEKEKRKSYLDQTPDERKSTVKEIVNKVANKM
ncbi:MAG: zinc ribbon domain-containing protein [Deltaproteobacteria bacterium]|jgi:putative FmdB family regulatory protein|nr:zinc ribbon domain-containing protein [Deltaproteobacteria bacterium]